MQLKIEYLPVGELKAYEKNTRKHEKYDISQIAKSIEKYGFNDAVGIWGDNYIVEGHGRVMAAKKLGITEVPCVRLDHLTDEERKEYGIIHNKSAELSSWDMELLAEELSELDMSDFDIDWELPEIETDEEIVEDEPPEPPEDPKAKRGDIYLLGEHRLMCGDSTSIEDVKTLTDGQLVDMLLTDPPYNVSLGQNGGHALRPSEAKQLHRRTDGLVIQNDSWSSDEEFIEFLVSVYKAALEVMKPGAVFYIWYADNQALNFRLACKEAGMTVRQNLIWNKSVFAMGRQDYQWKHEPCLYGWKDGASHLWASDRKQTTVIDYAKPSKSELHPTMKPVGLFDYQIKNNTKGGDIVLDLFGGSGTSIIASEQNGRVCYTMEIDERYIDTIIARYIAFKGNDEDVWLIRDGEKIKYSELNE